MMTCLDVLERQCIRGYDDVYDEACGFWLGLGLGWGSGVVIKDWMIYFGSRS